MRWGGRDLLEMTCTRLRWRQFPRSQGEFRGEIHAPQTCTGRVYRHRGRRRARAGRTDRHRVRRPLPPPALRRGGPALARPAEGHAARSRTHRRPGGGTDRQRVPGGRRGRRTATLTRPRLRRGPGERRGGGADRRHDRRGGHRPDRRDGSHPRRRRPQPGRTHLRQGRPRPGGAAQGSGGRARLVRRRRHQPRRRAGRPGRRRRLLPRRGRRRARSGDGDAIHRRTPHVRGSAGR